MGLLFNRRPRQENVVDPATAGHTNGHHHESHRERREKHRFDKETGHFNRRPSFGQW